MNSQEYWEDRERQKQQKVDEITDVEVEKVRKAIEDAIDDLNRQIRDIYMKYAVDNNMSYADTLKYLTNDERKEFQKDLQYYLEKYRDSDYVKKNKKELHSLSVRARVQRIEVFIANIKQHASDLEEMLNTGTREQISQLYTEGYLRNAYDILGSQEPTTAQVVPAFNTRVVREIMETPWSGKNYSKKVWDLSNNFEQKLEEVLTRGLIQGKHPDVIAREFREAGFGKERRNKDGSMRKGGIAWSAEALIRTEAANLIEQAQLNSYTEFNTERYVFMTSKDYKVCDTCQELEGKDFAVEEAKTSVNYPPMHPICRCTTRAKTRYDDEDESQYDLPYDEWYEKYVQPEIDKIHAEQAKAKLSDGLEEIEKEYGKLNTKEVVLTDERLEHIKSRHPEVVDVLLKEYKDCVSKPDVILNDEKNANTMMTIRKLGDNNLNTIVKLSVGVENEDRQNSIITAFCLGDKRLKRLMSKNKVIYTKEKQVYTKSEQKDLEDGDIVLPSLAREMQGWYAYRGFG